MQFAAVCLGVVGGVKGVHGGVAGGQSGASPPGRPHGKFGVHREGIDLVSTFGGSTCKTIKAVILILASLSIFGQCGCFWCLLSKF